MGNSTQTVPQSPAVAAPPPQIPYCLAQVTNDTRYLCIRQHCTLDHDCPAVLPSTTSPALKTSQTPLTKPTIWIPRRYRRTARLNSTTPLTKWSQKGMTHGQKARARMIQWAAPKKHIPLQDDIYSPNPPTSHLHTNSKHIQVLLHRTSTPPATADIPPRQRPSRHQSPVQTQACLVTGDTATCNPHTKTRTPAGRRQTKVGTRTVSSSRLAWWETHRLARLRSWSNTWRVAGTRITFRRSESISWRRRFRYAIPRLRFPFGI